MKQETIVMYTAPGISHIVPMVELAKKLVLQLPNHYSFTILLTTGFIDHPSMHSYTTQISTSYPSISFHRLPLVTLNSDNSPLAKCFEFVYENVTHVTSTLTQISQTSKVKALIVDLCSCLGLSMTSCMGIPVYHFFTSGAAILSMLSYIPIIHSQTSESLKDLDLELQIPGCSAPIKANQMPDAFLNREDPGYFDILNMCKEIPKSNGILANTFQELEPVAVKAIAEGLCFPDPKQRPPVYYVGPLISPPSDNKQDAGDAGKECLLWLEKQPSKSVVYLCFGSLGGRFPVEQLKEIADGLEKSGQRFLWVVKRPITYPDDEEFVLSSVLPIGFLERTKDRGLVVNSWAPQVEVLNHESVGVFMSHCGWNSLLEGVAAGVPMIAWPLYSEQKVLRSMMVDDIQVAVGVEMREEDGFVSGEEVEKRVREVMESERGKELRENSLKMKEVALGAFEESGSSKTALATLVQTWTTQ